MHGHHLKRMEMFLFGLEEKLAGAFFWIFMITFHDWSHSQCSINFFYLLISNAREQGFTYFFGNYQVWCLPVPTESKQIMSEKKIPVLGVLGGLVQPSFSRSSHWSATFTYYWSLNIQPWACLPLSLNTITLDKIEISGPYLRSWKSFANEQMISSSLKIGETQPRIKSYRTKEPM